jgi:lipoprotein-anchoring transpeptidase ErfK/SrfK
MRRYIYIHGSPDSAVMGVPGSIGCIRMHNKDLLDLFERINVGDEVHIAE